MAMTFLIDFTPKKEGILLIDKPSDWTSHDVVAKLRNVLKIKKIGHSGTLDPIATGLLIILIGRQYTKQQDTFMKQDKVYEVAFKLGETTDTYDRTGSITSTADEQQLNQLSEEQVIEAIKSFQRTYQQTVPAYSAVKINGKKLYNQARKNQTPDVLPSRQVTISAIEDVDVSDFQKITMTVTCSSGTYIRSLVHDIGQALQVGATMTALRRTKIGAFSVDQAIKLPT